MGALAIGVLFSEVTPGHCLLTPPPIQNQTSERRPGDQPSPSRPAFTWEGWEAEMGLELWLDLDQQWSVIVFLEGGPLPRPKCGLLPNTQK